MVALSLLEAIPYVGIHDPSADEQAERYLNNVREKEKRQAAALKAMAEEAQRYLTERREKEQKRAMAGKALVNERKQQRKAFLSKRPCDLTQALSTWVAAAPANFSADAEVLPAIRHDADPAWATLPSVVSWNAVGDNRVSAVGFRPSVARMDNDQLTAPKLHAKSTLVHETETERQSQWTELVLQANTGLSKMSAKARERQIKPGQVHALRQARKRALARERICDVQEGYMGKWSRKHGREEYIDYLKAETNMQKQETPQSHDAAAPADVRWLAAVAPMQRALRSNYKELARRQAALETLAEARWASPAARLLKAQARLEIAASVLAKNQVTVPSTSAACVLLCRPHLPMNRGQPGNRDPTNCQDVEKAAAAKARLLLAKQARQHGD